jgi:hypothetical protein
MTVGKKALVIMTFGIVTFSLMTIGIMTFSTMKLSIMKLSIMTLPITTISIVTIRKTISAHWHYIFLVSWVFTVRLSVIKLNVVAP